MFKKYYAFKIMCALILLTGVFLYSQNMETGEQQPITWKLVSVYPSDSSIYRNGMEKFAKDIKDISNEKLVVDYYTAGEYRYKADGREEKIIGRYDVFDAVSKGIIEMGFGTSPYWAKERIPEGELMYSIPFGLKAKDMYAWLIRGGGLELWKEMYEPFNVIPFPVGDTGGAMGGWFRNKIEKIENFKGMKIRNHSFSDKIFKEVGAETYPISSTKSLSAYKNKDIDAIIILGPYGDQGYEIDKDPNGPKNYYYPGWQEPCGVISLIINKTAWDNLPENLRKTIEIVCGNTYQFLSNQFDTMNSKILPELQKEGVELIRFPPDVLREFRRKTTEVLEKEAEKNSKFNRIYQSFKKFKENNIESGWGKMVDEAVYSETASSNISEMTASKFIEGLADLKVAKVVAKGNNIVGITFSGFTTWSSNLPTDLVSGIERIVTIIRDNSFSIKGIRIEGHGATDGEDCANWEISKRRANAVAELLIAKGKGIIDKSLIKVVPRGEGDPIIVPDDTEEKRRMNRRVEIVIEF